MSLAKLFLLIVLFSNFTNIFATNQYIYEEPSRVTCKSKTSEFDLAPNHSQVDMLITDNIAQIVYKQTFINSSDDSVEAAYVFPMPHNASVNSMTYILDERAYLAKIMEKERAEEMYDSLKNVGQNVGLLLQYKPNIFQQKISIIPPKDTVEVIITLTMPLKYSEGELELSFPTFIGQRYGSGVTGGTVTGDNPWNPPATVGGPNIDFNVIIQTGYEIEQISSPTHPLIVGGVDNLLESDTIAKNLTLPNQYAAILQTLNSYPNSDFIIRFSRKTLETTEFSVSQYYDMDTKKGYFAATLYPNELLDVEGRDPLDVLILVDISGSQGGWPLTKEKEIGLSFLNKLTPEDNVGILSFEDNVEYAFKDPYFVKATAENIATGENFISSLSTKGGTNLYGAIDNLLNISTDKTRKKIFIVLTDGFITNEEAIFQRISEEPNVSMFTFGAGDNLNTYFLEKAAEVGNGFSMPLTSSEDVEEAVDEAWGKIESPQITNINVTCTGNADLIVPFSTSLYKGNSYTVYGEITNPTGAVTLDVTGKLGDDDMSYSKDILFSNEKNSSWALPKLWAKNKIYNLELLDTEELEKENIIAISEEFQVLSKYTAFIAYESVPVEEYNAPGYASAGAVSVYDYNSKPSNRSFSIKGFSLVIGPNPVLSTSKVYINCDNFEEDVTIELYDTEGKLIGTKKIGDVNGEFSFILSDIATIDSGVYYVILKTNGHIKALTEFYKI